MINKNFKKISALNNSKKDFKNDIDTYRALKSRSGALGDRSTWIR